MYLQILNNSYTHKPRDQIHVGTCGLGNNSWSTCLSSKMISYYSKISSVKLEIISTHTPAETLGCHSSNFVHASRISRLLANVCIHCTTPSRREFSNYCIICQTYIFLELSWFLALSHYESFYCILKVVHFLNMVLSTG